MTVVSCAIPIHDSEWCGDMGNQGAQCFHTLTNEQRTLEKSEWDALRFGQVCTSPLSFAELKSALEKLCHQTKNCVYPKAQMNAFFQRMEAISRVTRN